MSLQFFGEDSVRRQCIPNTKSNNWFVLGLRKGDDVIWASVYRKEIELHTEKQHMVKQRGGGDFPTEIVGGTREQR